MKVSAFLNRKTAIAVSIFLSFIFVQITYAQEAPSTVYLEITKLKKMNDDFMDMTNELMKPYVQERIKQGNQLAHAMFRVFFPHSDNQEYDYVIMDVYNDFNHLHLGDKKMGEMAYQVFPNANIPKMIHRFETAAKNAGTEVFVIRDEAFPGPNGGDGKIAKFVQVNHMKVSEANSGVYTRMESEIFKPIHQARAKAGGMHDWVLAQRIMPYGSEWDNNFLTFDIFSEWGDMAGGSMNKLFAEIHPDKNADDIWNKMAQVRELRRSETWELLSFVNTPAPEVTYNMVKEGTGPSPMNGQEVAWRGKIMDMEGNEMFRTQVLGFDFYNVVGKNYYDRYFDKGLKQMKKGGVLNIALPPDAQDTQTKNISGGKPVIMNIELVDIAPAKPNGAKMLEKKIEMHGLSVAKQKYKKLQADNPKGYVFREGAMNNLGYTLLSKGDTDAALYIFKLNQEMYPKSWNACDSLADGYMAAGNHAKAKHCYEMALKINPEFKAAKDKLSKL